MVELAEIEQIFSIILSIATVMLVFLFWKTIKQLEETVKVSKIQSEYRFRPWVGPSKQSELQSIDGGRNQYSITIQNFGELPASDVIVKYAMKTDEIKKDQLNNLEYATFKLGPLLPSMEKRYWFFISSELIQQAKEGKSKIYIALYLEYDFASDKSGYGMISKFDEKNEIFIHTDMWVDTNYHSTR